MPHLKISHQFIGYLILLSILPLLVVGLVSYQTAASTLTDEASRYALELVRNQRDYIDLQLEQVQSLMSNISGVEEIRTVLEDADAGSDTYTDLTTRAQIGYILNSFSDLRGLVSIDIFAISGAHYHVGDTLNTENIRVSLRDRIFAEALTSDKFVTWAGIEDNININSDLEKVVTAAKVFYKLNRDTLRQEPVGLLIVNYNVDYLYDHLSSIHLDANAYMVVLDGQHRIIYHPDRPLRGEHIQPELIAALISDSGTTQLVLDAIPYSVSYVRSDFSDWTVISLIPVETLAAKAAPIQRTTTLTLLGAFVAVTLIGLVYNRRVVLPIRQITRQYQALEGVPGSAGPQHVPVRGNDEITDLSQWFNTFLDILETERLTEEALRASLATTEILYEFSRTMIGIQDLPNLLQTVVDNLITLLKTDRVVLILLDLEAQEILHLVKSGPGIEWVANIGFDELMEGLTGWALRERLPALSPKGQPDARESAAVQQRRAVTTGGDIIVVPLIYHESCLGTLTATMDPQGRDFSQRDVDLLTTLANQAAVAIANARLVGSLRESEEKFYKAFHASPDPISIVSLVGGRFIDVNESFLRFSGYARHETIGRRPDDIGIWTDCDEERLFKEKLREQGFVRDFEAGIRSRSGNPNLVVLMSAEMVELKGERCVLIAAKDITENKRVERQRLELAMERERVQILSDFINKASHEFKTPLSIINTKVYLALRSLGQGQHNAYLEQIGDQVKTITTLVDSLSLMARLDSGYNDFHFIDLNLNDILNVFHFSYRQMWQDAHITCAFEPSPEPLIVRGDMDYMKQAIEHLLVNAIQYTRPGGRIGIVSRRAGNQGIIEIQDTGIGITQEEREHIFERFYRADKAGTERGFGLGLPIAKAVIEQFGGRIEVESVVGEGSLFRVILPLR